MKYGLSAMRIVFNFCLEKKRKREREREIEVCRGVYVGWSVDLDEDACVWR